jgi:hypothetical protein
MYQGRKSRPWILVALIAGLVALAFVVTPDGPGKAEAQTGSTLIGKQEGPEVITDASQWPKTFNEAPQLAELVKQGKLPPVQDRIGRQVRGHLAPRL